MLHLEKQPEEKIIHELFDVGIILKGAHAIIEIMSGIFAYFVSQNFIISVVEKLTSGEISEDPTDFFVRYIVNLTHNFSAGSKEFVALYLFSHGIINLFLVVALLNRKIWAYPTSIIILSLFNLYSIYRYLYHPSFLLVALTTFNFIIIWLIVLEYKRLK